MVVEDKSEELYVVKKYGNILPITFMTLLYIIVEKMYGTFHLKPYSDQIEHAVSRLN